MNRLTLAAPLALALGLAFGLAAPALADTPPGAQLTVTAEGKSTRAPDIANFTAGVASTGRTAGEAMAANAAAMNRAIAALKGAGIAERDIQTSNLSLFPEYANRQPGDDSPPAITGYRASNNVSVRARDLSRLGQVIDALVAAGTNEINGPNFAVDQADAALDEARVAAVRAARQRAELYAQAAGLHVARITRITEGEAEQPVRVYAVPMLRRAAAPTPVAAGEVDLTATVTVQFELAP